MADEFSPRPSVAQLSKTPSWVMLGFVLGALVVWALPRRAPAPAPRPVVVAPPVAEPARPARPPEVPSLTTIEAVFAEWSSGAVWDDNRTEVALWNAAVGDYVEFYEVRRIEGTFYFRSIPQLTGVPLRHGKPAPPECPLRFTETEAQYREWLEHGRRERPVERVRPTVVLPPPTPPNVQPRVESVPVSPNITGTVPQLTPGAGSY
ncbi:hypothetical protein [Opitutus sp. ER46]|uniref:hypothetical protein n=1 Tax=Opitutus sp. ER46 TaxID=2161864 RepID=UPI000D2FE255|nr:hypothetical protein [Opitutus sp. ER46]PTX92453.1 hypothetical protein DB354_14050 [Opitutus sp. ER46]